MKSTNSTVTGQLRNIGIRAVTIAEEPRVFSVTSICRAISRSVRRWIVGRRDGVQIVTVQRADFSIIT